MAENTVKEEKVVKAKKTTTKTTTKKVSKKASDEKVEKTTKAPTKKTTTKKTTKVAKAKKEETKATAEVKEVETKEKAKEVKAKPVVTEVHAKALNVKVTPRKARLVIDLVRGKNCKEAIEILFNVNRKASPIVAKVIKSAMANATNNFNMNEDKLFISDIQASDATKMRRFLPRAKGSASGMVKRFSNIFVTVKEK